MDLLHQPWRVRHDDYRRDIPDNTGHSDVAQQALDWLQTCLKTHTTCMCDLRTPAYYPKRLLDLGPPKGRLILTSSERPCSQYATLSHCWGSTSFFWLCSSSEDELRRRLPVEQLPRSFREAIIFTQRLGIRYLWIDSLCILQEGPGHAEDWNEQAPLMHSIYSNGVVNISVLHAQNPYIGAFKTRNPDMIQPCHVSWSEDGADEKVWAILDECTDLHYAIGQSTLSKRGWVVQERMLSPRTIHFGSDRIFWECRSGNLLTESYISGMGSIQGLDGGFDLSISKVPISSRLQAWEISDAWHRVIKYYSAAKLSKPEKDKLVAIPGIARYFGTFFDHQYVAGFFRCHLPSDLLWESLEEDDYLPPQLEVEAAGKTTYQGPTWSWVSTNSMVRFTPLRKDERAQVTVERVDVQLLGQQNKYGQIKNAKITLCGVLLPCKLVDDQFKGWGRILQPESKDQNRPGVYLTIKLDRTSLSTTNHSYMALPFVVGDYSKFIRTGLFLQNTPNQGEYTRVEVIYGSVHIPQDYSCQTVRII